VGAFRVQFFSFCNGPFLLALTTKVFKLLTFSKYKFGPHLILLQKIFPLAHLWRALGYKNTTLSKGYQIKRDAMLNILGKLMGTY
jgi:hypothetical protein